MAADPAKAWLHLIRDHHASGPADHRDRRVKEAFFQRRKSLVGKGRAEHETGKAEPAFLQLSNRARDIVGKGLCLSFQRAAHGPQAVGCGHQPDMAGIPANRRAPRRQDGNRGGIAVIGVVGRDHAGLAGHRLRHAQRDVIRLGSGADHDHLAEVVLELAGQPFDVIQNIIVQVARVGVQRRRLFRDRLDHLGVAVADMRHIVVAVQIGPAVLVPHMHARGAGDMHRVVVKSWHIRPHQARAAGDHICHSVSFTAPRRVFTSPLWVLAANRRRFDPRVGFVAMRGLGFTVA